MIARADSSSGRNPKLPTGRAIALSRFFDAVFWPCKLRNRSRAYADVFRTGIKWFRRCLGREPTLLDLNRGTVQTLVEYLARQNLSKSRVGEVRKRILALWKFAHALGFAPDYDAPPLPDIAPNCQPWRFEEPQPGTLLHFYRQDFRPLFVGTASPNRRSLFDAAVTRFHDFAARQIPLEEITEGTLREFRTWLQTAGVNERYARQAKSAIRRVLQVWNPERFPLRGGKTHLIENETSPKPARFPEPKPGTIRHFFETIYRPQQLLDVTPETIRDYGRTMAELHKVWGYDPKLSTLNDSDVSDFLKVLLSRGLRPVTVNTFRTRLLALWRFAYDRGLVENPPKVKKLREHVEEPDAWTEEEAKRIIEAAAKLDRKPIEGIPAGKWWRAFLLVGWWTALRRSSLLKIRRCDVDLEQRWVYIPADRIKTRRGKRFRLGKDAVEALREIWKPHRDLLFPYQGDKRKLGEHFNAILKLAGLPRSNRKAMTQLHKWRRTVATCAAVRAGLAAAMSLLGHSSPEMTKRYIDPTRLPGNDATDFLPELGDQGAP